MRILNVEIEECKKCPFRQVGTYKYIDSNDTVDYCLLARRTIYWTYARNGIPEMCPLPIKIKEDN